MDATKALEVVAKAASALAATALVLSIIYDWGFIFALNLGFIEVPTTISDHIRSALVWLPGTLLAILVLISYEFFLKRLEKGRTEEEIIQSSSNPKLIRKIRVSPRIFYRIFASAGAAVFLLLGDPYRAFMLVCSIIMWSIFSDWVTNVPLLRLRSSEIVMILFHWVPIVFFFVFFLGYNKAADLASSTTSHIRLNLSDGKPSVEVNILRYIDKGVLVVQLTTKVVSLLQWSQVDSIEVLEPYKPYQGLLARWLRKKAAPSKAMQPVP